MNALICVPWDQDSGGVASVVGHVAEHLVRSGHKAYFLHPGTAFRLRTKVTKWGFNGFELPLLPPADPASTLKSRLAFAIMLLPTLLRLWRLLNRLEVDVVNVHYPSAGFSYFAVLRLFRRETRLVTSIHGTDVLPSSTGPATADALTRFLFQWSDAIVAPSLGFGEQCRRVLPRRDPAFRVIHNGVDVSAFADIGRTPPGTDTILCIASLDPWKGLNVLISAMAIVRQHAPTACVVIAGSGAALSSLTELRDRLGLGANVKFSGYQGRREIHILLERCAFLVLPSLSEPFGLVLLEAQASARAVIATRVGGIPEVVKDAETGLLVGAGDSQALAKAMLTLLSDRRLAERLGEAGRKWANEFSWDRTGTRYVALFETLVPTGSRTG